MEDQRSIEELQEEAWRVYRNHNQVEHRQLEKVITNATIAALRGEPPKGPLSGQRNERGGQGPDPKLPTTQCTYCKKEGHWRRDCPQLKPKMIAELDQC